MGGFSKKEYLSLKMPTEDAPVSDHRRIQLALTALGYEPVTFSKKVLQKLYPLCRDGNFDITVTLVHREFDWVVTDVETGDTTACHYGLAVDYGSTTIVMQLVDMNSGAIIGTETAVNGQVAYGTDILTRITYALEEKEHAAQLREATVETFHRLLEQLTDSTGVAAAGCPVMIISGNTTMIHFLLELNAWTVFASPLHQSLPTPAFCGDGSWKWTLMVLYISFRQPPTMWVVILSAVCWCWTFTKKRKRICFLISAPTVSW